MNINRIQTPDQERIRIDHLLEARDIANAERLMAWIIRREDHLAQTQCEREPTTGLPAFLCEQAA